MIRMLSSRGATGVYALLAAVCMVAVGCGGSDTTSVTPPPPFALAVSGAVSIPGRYIARNGLPAYACDFVLQATATGGGSGAYAAWTSAEADFRLTSNGTVSTLFFTSTDLQDWFGSDRILSGSVKSAATGFNWSGPWTADLIVRYLVLTPDGNSEARSATVPLTCA